MRPTVSVIATTYNWPQALDRVLDGLARQTCALKEVVIADDGSGPETLAVIDAWRPRLPFPLVHARQEDLGFRAARARNLAASQASGDYLIYLDGDGLVFPGFVEGHMRHAEPGWFTVGRRCYLRRWLSQPVLEKKLSPHAWPKTAFFPLALLGGSNRPFQLLPVPMSEARRRNKAREWNKAQTCNLGVWRGDLLRVGGFDESYEGYGLEDTDFVVRLIRAGVLRKTLEHADPVLHIWHPRRKTGDDNRKLLDAIMANTSTQPAKSLFLEEAS